MKLSLKGSGKIVLKSQNSKDKSQLKFLKISLLNFSSLLKNILGEKNFDKNFVLETKNILENLEMNFSQGDDVIFFELENLEEVRNLIETFLRISAKDDDGLSLEFRKIMNSVFSAISKILDFSNSHL